MGAINIGQEDGKKVQMWTIVMVLDNISSSLDDIISWEEVLFLPLWHEM